MARNSKTTAMPRLRFTDFHNDPEWKSTPLSSIADPVTERAEAGDGSQVLTLSGEHGLLLQSEYFGKQVAGTNSGRYIKISRNDFVYNDRTTKQSAYGTIKRLSRHEGGIVSPIYKCFRFDIGENPAFWDFYFESGIHDAELRALVNEGARAGRFNISIDRFLSTTGWRPEAAEQQRIADCLVSLDEVMAGQQRKVEVLAAHKRGLMQQLFPREGEPLPRHRFPEFRGGPEWEEAPLGDLFDTTTGGTPDRANKEYWNGSIPWVTTSLVDFNVITRAEEFISEAGLAHSSAKVFPKDTVLIALYGQGKTRGKVALLGIEATTNQACAAILPGNDIDPLFTFANLCGRYEEMRALSNSGGQENLSQGLIRELPFRYPPDVEEQSRIVGCLSSLDATIAAESEHLGALKTHKHGLVRQLFPSPEYGL